MIQLVADARGVVDNNVGGDIGRSMSIAEERTPRRRVVTPRVESRMRGLREQGLTYAEIGKEVGVSAVTVSYYLDPAVKERMINHSRERNRAFPEYQKRWREAHPITQREWYVNRSDTYKRWREASRIQNAGKRATVIALLGGKCSECGVGDLRVLQINHIESNGQTDFEKYNRGSSLCRAILKGERDTEDLNLLCANCNQIYEYKLGRRSVLGRRARLHSAVTSLLGGKCIRCRNSDSRVLQINHIDGGGRTDHANYASSMAFLRAILGNRRGAGDLSVLCANCNQIYEYEQGRRKEAAGTDIRKLMPAPVDEFDKLREELKREVGPVHFLTYDIGRR